MYSGICQAHSECVADARRVVLVPSLLQRGQTYDMECEGKVARGVQSQDCM